MGKVRYLWSSRFALACGLVAMAGPVVAQKTAATDVEEVVVTGSYIAGSREDSALPIDVIGAEDLKKQGSPTVVQLVKSLPAAAASIGESNRFLGRTAGSATINLRGFGSARTLVLMNGRRMAASPIGAVPGVDINLIPVAAVGRIEVLKGGAAATYGSDAVGGVVNFITRKDLDGFEAAADYAYIRGSDGDYNGSLAWGRKFDRGDVLITGGYRRRSQLKTTDRGWAVQANILDPLGGWSGASNPGQYQTFALGGATGAVAAGAGFGQPAASAANPARTIALTTFNDVGCTELGGFRNAAGACLFQYSRFDSLVDNEYHYQAYGEANYELTDDLKFHAEGFWSRHVVPAQPVSPSQSTIVFPTPIAASGSSPGGGTSPFPALGTNEQSRFYIPFANPGLQVLSAAQCTGVVSAFCTNIRNGVTTSQTGWRPLAYSGNPLSSDGADHQRAAVDSFRVSGGLKGKVFGAVNFDSAVTFMDSRGEIVIPNSLANRLQLALRGLGGPSCNPNTGAPGVGGCQWLNPFANAIQKDAVYGLTNPFFNAAAVPANTNTNEVLDWITENAINKSKSQLLVGDVVFTGKAPLKLWGDELSWALGGQIRHDRFAVTPNKLGDISQTPCVDSIDDGLPACRTPTGAFVFIPVINASDIERTIYAAFGEIRLPITDTLNATFAMRVERYGGAIGTTTNPKFDVRWQALPWIAFRGSVGTTFRAPPQSSVTPGFDRVNVQFNDPSTTPATPLYRPQNRFNNPDLKPETADHYNVGAIVSAGPFSASIDYWRFKFKDELTVETPAAIYNTMFPGSTAATWQCANASLRSRFTFAQGSSFVNALDGSNCHPSNFLAVRTNLINGPDVDTSGVDFQADYRLALGESQLTLGVEGSYLVKYDRGELFTLDGISIAPGLDRAGQLDLISTFYSYPRWKTNAYVNWSMGSHNLRATFNYVSPSRDRNHDADTVTPGLQPAQVGAYMQVGLVYQVVLPWQTTLTAQIQNLFDEAPSFAYSQYNYDYTLGNPLGRVFGLGVRKRF